MSESFSKEELLLLLPDLKAVEIPDTLFDSAQEASVWEVLLQWLIAEGHAPVGFPNFLNERTITGSKLRKKLENKETHRRNLKHRPAHNAVEDGHVREPQRALDIPLNTLRGVTVAGEHLFVLSTGTYSLTALAEKQLLDAFHIAKLSLFNIRLLSSMECERQASPNVAALVGQSIRANGLTAPISLMHQATFLSHTYVCFGWLWEVSMKHKLNEKLLSRIEARIFASGKAPQWTNVANTYRDRDLSNLRERIKTCRNGVSHGSVQVDDKMNFLFSDHDSKDLQQHSCISIPMEDVGVLCDHLVFAMSDICYSSS